MNQLFLKRSYSGPGMIVDQLEIELFCPNQAYLYF